MTDFLFMIATCFASVVAGWLVMGALGRVYYRRGYSDGYQERSNQVADTLRMIRERESQRKWADDVEGALGNPKVWS